MNDDHEKHGINIFTAEKFYIQYEPILMKPHPTAPPPPILQNLVESYGLKASEGDIIEFTLKDGTLSMSVNDLDFGIAWTGIKILDPARDRLYLSFENQGDSIELL